MDPDWSSTCSRSSQKQHPPRNGVGRGKSEERWESGSNGVVQAGKHASGIVSTLSHTRTKHTLPTQRLNYPSTLKITQAGVRQTAVRVCPCRRDAQRCLPVRDAVGHRALVRGHPPPLAFLSSACVPHGWGVSNLPAEQARGLVRARVQLRADLQAMRGSGESTSPPRSGQWNPRPLCPAAGQAVPLGERPSPVPGKPKRSYQTFQGKARAGVRERCASSVQAASLPCG